MTKCGMRIVLLPVSNHEIWKRMVSTKFVIVIVIKGKQLRRSPRVRESYVAFFYLLCERVFDVCFKGNDVRLFLTNPWRSLGALSRQSVRASIRRPKLPGFVHPFLVLCDWGEKINSLVQQTRAQMKKCGITRLRS